MKKLTTRQQLNLCEFLSLLYRDGPEILEEAEKVIDSIYRISHLNGTCKNEHLDWHKEGHEMGKAFKECGVGDYNK